MKLPILYEDADIVAVDKPAGLLTHGEGESAEKWFLENYPEVDFERPYAHRLDRETSGVLVFAKNQVAHDFLRKAFTDRDVKKEYLAFVYGVPKEKKGTIDFEIGRSRKDFRLRSAQPKAKGKLREALTRYEVIGTDGEGKHALLKLNPETGRTHQIRVHLKAIHHPIVGDKLYAAGHAPDLGFDRLGLHARQLDLPLPSGSRVLIESPIPSELQKAIVQFK